MIFIVFSPVRVQVGWANPIVSGAPAPPATPSSLWGNRLFGPRLFGKRLFP